MHFFPPFIKGCYITYSILSRAYISSQDLSPHSADMYTTTIHFVLSREYTLSTLHSYWPAPQHMWNPPSFECSLLDVFEQKHFPSFLPFTILGFLISSLQCLHTFLVTKVHLVGVSSIILFFFPPTSLSAIVSISFFCTPYILTYQPVIDVYGFANSSFSWYTKIPYAHCILFFLKPSHLRILFLFSYV